MTEKHNSFVNKPFRTILIFLLIALDQVTKYFAVNGLMGKDDIILIPKVLQLHYLENTGAAFSILEGKQTVFAIATPIFVLILIYIYNRIPKTKYLLMQYILVFIIAGAFGNYIDRISNRYVVDFIYFSLIDFPVFNVADCYVTVAIFALLYTILFYYKDEDLETIKGYLKLKKNG